MTKPLTRRQALGTIGGMVLAGCQSDRLLGPLMSLGVESFSLTGAGDVHAHRFNADAKTASLLGQFPGDLIFALGDNAGVHGTADDYLRYDSTWGPYKDRTRFQMGNHEINLDPLGTAYYDYAGSAAGERGQGYYAETLGSWRVYWLNGELRKPGTTNVLHPDEIAWLKADLAANPGLHKAAFWHRPMFISPAKVAPTRWMKPFWDALYQARAEIVVNGHCHWYERFPRMRPDGVIHSSGMREFVVGTGGGILMTLQGPRHVASRKLITGAHGVFRLTLNPGGYSWAFMDITGAVRDTGTQLCRVLA